MKKIVFILLITILSVHAYSQKGDLTVGAKGGCIYSGSQIKFTNVLYGIDIAYHVSYPLEVAFTGLMNTNIPRDESALSVYSANLDFRLYLLGTREWKTGPALGGNYYMINDKGDNLDANKALGFNIGWHFRINLTDYVKLNGGWRYTNAKAKDRSSWRDDATLDVSHNFFYVGLAYTFELK